MCSGQSSKPDSCRGAAKSFSRWYIKKMLPVQYKTVQKACLLQLYGLYSRSNAADGRALQRVVKEAFCPSHIECPGKRGLNTPHTICMNFR